MDRAGYSDSISAFLQTADEVVLGHLLARTDFAVELTQRDAWIEQIKILKPLLHPYAGRGSLHLEYAVPRLGKRIDTLVIIDGVIFVLEFKVGEREFTSHAIDQVCDYALDLKNFHETSHRCYIAPILIATRARSTAWTVASTPANDRLLCPIASTPATLDAVLTSVLAFCSDGEAIDTTAWAKGRYCPTPTIIEAAMALYGGHGVAEISRSDASAINLTATSDAVSAVIRKAREQSHKSICFVTGVPGAGKTLVGLNIATQHINKESDLYSVFLSGNGPLVAILREALARDKVRREAERGQRVKKGAARSEVKAFIQNVHHFRDDCLADPGPPVEHVALFDEAQRAWNLAQTAKFMQQKKGRANFNLSEPEFLISCLDRHPDWAVIVCLVGGGQEINTGEAGIGEWIDALLRSFPQWRLHISSRLTDSEYGAGRVLEQVQRLPNVTLRDELHLSVSMRSFRAEHVSLLVKQLLDLDAEQAAETMKQIGPHYPIKLTRRLAAAKEWIRQRARGSERYGIVVSSQAQRLKPHAIDVRSPIDPIHWFLDGKEDVRSSYYLEDVATEFHVQGLELDWACVTWDADFRHTGSNWEHWSFCGDRWNRIRKPERQAYLKNAYRVLLTRARQGMVIVVPDGDAKDPTRDGAYYDSTFHYLRNAGFEVID